MDQSIPKFLIFCTCWLGQGMCGLLACMRFMKSKSKGLNLVVSVLSTAEKGECVQRGVCPRSAGARRKEGPGQRQTLGDSCALSRISFCADFRYCRGQCTAFRVFVCVKRGRDKICNVSKISDYKRSDYMGDPGWLSG